MKIFIFVFAMLLSITLVSEASFAGYKDSVINKSGAGIVDSNGGCIRSKWDGGSANCGASEEANNEEEICEIEDAITDDKATGEVKESFVVYFDFDKDRIRSDATETLDLALDYVGEDKGEAKVNIIGYADRISSEEYNVDLSRRRALNVKSYLAERGLKRVNTTVDALGETEPVTDCEGELDASLISCLQEDRRVVVEIR